MKTAWTVLCIGILGTGMLMADTVGVVKKTCPLCATAFEAELDLSGTQFSQRLDLKPIGPIAAPWRLAVCPQCHFVLYTDELSGEERDSRRRCSGTGRRTPSPSLTRI